MSEKRKPWYRSPAETAPRPIPIHVVLARLDEICKQEGYFAKANLYVATQGVMLEFRAVTRILSDSDLNELEKLRSLISGTLYVVPCQEDGKMSDGTDFKFRMVEVSIKTNGTVVVLPAAKRPS